jgi:thiol-disulfide isomerase/thioredoxin
MSRILLTLSVLLVILVILRIYINRSYEGFQGGASKSVIICKAEWCGHCKKAAPEFSKLLGASPITLKDGSQVNVKVLDDAKDKSEIAQYNVKGYPSVLIVDAGQTTEYPGPRTADGIIEFLNSNY